MKITFIKSATRLLILAGIIVTISAKTGRPGTVFTAPASANAVVNPLKGNTTAATAGKKIYDAVCFTCHGLTGKGDGPAAAALSKPPANHTSAAIQKLSDGALFWMITTGSTPMPAYKATYSDTQRWQLVNYIRTLAVSAKK